MMRSFKSLVFAFFVATAAVSSVSSQARAQLVPTDFKEFYNWVMWQQKVHDLKRDIADLKDALKEGRIVVLDAERHYFQMSGNNIKTSLRQQYLAAHNLYASARVHIEIATTELEKTEETLDSMLYEPGWTAESMLKEMELVLDPRIQSIIAVLNTTEYFLNMAFVYSRRDSVDIKVRQRLFDSTGKFAPLSGFNFVELLVILRQIIAIVRTR